MIDDLHKMAGMDDAAATSCKDKCRKLFVVKFMCGANGRSRFILDKAFASKMPARLYVEQRCKSFLSKEGIAFKPRCGIWENDMSYAYEDNDEGVLLSYEIEDVEIDENIELPPMPDVENENLALKEENIKLHEQLAHAKGLNAAARCFLTMWDGGNDYAKEHVLELMNEARAVLEDGEHGNALVMKMFEEWLEAKRRNECAH